MPHAAHVAIGAIPALSRSIAQLTPSPVPTVHISNKDDVSQTVLILIVTSSGGFFPTSTTAISYIIAGTTVNISPRNKLNKLRLAALTRTSIDTVQARL